MICCKVGALISVDEHGKGCFPKRYEIKPVSKQVINELLPVVKKMGK